MIQKNNFKMPYSIFFVTLKTNLVRVVLKYKLNSTLYCIGYLGQVRKRIRAVLYAVVSTGYLRVTLGAVCACGTMLQREIERGSIEFL